MTKSKTDDKDEQHLAGYWKGLAVLARRESTFHKRNVGDPDLLSRPLRQPSSRARRRETESSTPAARPIQSAKRPPGISLRPGPCSARSKIVAVVAAAAAPAVIGPCLDVRQVLAQKCFEYAAVASGTMCSWSDVLGLFDHLGERPCVSSDVTAAASSRFSRALSASSSSEASNELRASFTISALPRSSASATAT